MPNYHESIRNKNKDRAMGSIFIFDHILVQTVSMREGKYERMLPMFILG